MANYQSDIKKLDSYLQNNVNSMIEYVCYNKTPKFTLFLDERQQCLLSGFLKKNKICKYLFFGGADNTQRNIMGIFPKNMHMDTALFPISVLKIEVFGNNNISHRDYLGALMGMQIRREMIGDILINKSYCYVFTMSTISHFLFQDLKFIGNNTVKVSIEDLDSLSDFKQEFDYLSGVVSSLRLDCIVSLIIKKSRKICAEIIESGLLKLNYEINQNISKQIKENDVISIKGFGKFVFLGCEHKTKKDKLYVNIKVYK